MPYRKSRSMPTGSKSYRKSTSMRSAQIPVNITFDTRITNLSQAQDMIAQDSKSYRKVASKRHSSTSMSMLDVCRPCNPGLIF